MKRKALSTVSAIISILFVIGVLLIIVDIFCFDKQFYAKEYSKLNTASDIGMSEDDLSEATITLLDYLKGRRDDLTVYAHIGGIEREVFNTREKLHMADVRSLYKTAVLLAYCFFFIGIAYGIAALFYKPLRKHLILGYVKGNYIFFAILAALGIYAAVDFNSFWTNFHKLLFSNDLWLLDPDTDILISMVPEQFFFDLVMKIVIAGVVVIGALLTAAFIVKKRKFSGETYEDIGN